MAALLEVKNLSIEFYDHELPERVVKDFDLILQSGDRVGIVGESGCGKSTLAKTVLGLIEPSGGEVHFHGKSLRQMSKAERKEYK